ncbi:recombinase [Halochromatium sp.]
MSNDSEIQPSPEQPSPEQPSPEQIEKDNEGLVAAFEQWLLDAGLSDTTIGRHVDNISFFLEHFLQYYEPVGARAGADYVPEFLGDWFIRKAMWSSEASIKGNAASLKKFYAFLAERGEVERQVVKNLNQTIKLGMPIWLDNMREYMNLAEEDW